MAGTRSRRWDRPLIVLMLLTLSAALLFNLYMEQTPENDKPRTAPPPKTPGADRRVGAADMPPVGRSLFDFLFTQEQGGQKVYRIPFPFAALLNQLESQLAIPGSRPSSLRGVLIPLGRSLQRDAAAPDFFQYPRVVVAVDSAPPMNARRSGMLLKDRLYLGYHEKAALIEVISYNEAAGRFEFQVVKDYRPGEIPQVLYASRLVCTSCHQNQGPIFSRPSWAETNANPRVAARLREHSARFYGLPVKQPIDVANAIDDATDRANLFALTQLLWRRGCELNTVRSASIRCRADVFIFVLQYLLSGGRHFDANSSRYRNHLLPALTKSWKEKWPAGIHVPNPDLPNRNPLAEIGSSSEYPISAEEPARQQLATEDLIRFADVSSPFDPLTPRPSLENWPRDEKGLSRFIDGLSQFLAPQDIERLDAHLFAAGLKSRQKRSLNAACDFTRENREGSAELLKFRCGEKLSADRSSGNLYMRGRLVNSGKGSYAGIIENLGLDGADESRGLTVTGSAYEQNGTERVLRLDVVQETSTRHARLPNGNAIESVRLSAPELAPMRAPARTSFSGAASVSILEDFSAALEAIDVMALASEKDADGAFSARPFRRAVVMRSLFDHLGVPFGDWCCVDARNMPPVRVEESGSSEQDQRGGKPEGADAALDVFHRNCGACHGLSSATPPNFLFGDRSRVQSKLEECAERIYYRLEMWRLEPQRRPKTPMPPISDFQKMNLAQQPNLGPADVDVMKEYIAAVLRLGSEASGRREFARRAYANLSACGSSPNGSSKRSSVVDRLQ